MAFTTDETIYLKDAVIDRLFRIEGKIASVKALESISPVLEKHLRELENELNTLRNLKRDFEQSIYDSAHSVKRSEGGRLIDEK